MSVAFNLLPRTLTRCPFFIFIDGDKTHAHQLLASLDRIARECSLRPGAVISSVETEIDPRLLRRALEYRVDRHSLETTICLLRGISAISGIIEAVDPVDALDRLVAIHGDEELWYPGMDICCRQQAVKVFLDAHDALLQQER